MAPILAQGARIIAPKILQAVGTSAIAGGIMDKLKDDNEAEAPEAKAPEAPTQAQPNSMQTPPMQAPMPGVGMNGAQMSNASMAMPTMAPNPMQSPPMQASMPSAGMNGAQMAGLGLGGAAAGAGLSRMAGNSTPAAQNTAEMAEPQAESHDKGDKGDKNDKGIGGTLLAGLTGAFGGAITRYREAGDGENKVAAALKGGLAGGGAGVLSKMSMDAIEEDGGGLKAAITGAGAAGLTSTLKEGGPGVFSSALAGAGLSGGTNLLHDKMVEGGASEGLTDAIAGAGVGANLGNAYEGGLKGLALGGGAGAGIETLMNAGQNLGGGVLDTEAESSRGELEGGDRQRDGGGLSL